MPSRFFFFLSVWTKDDLWRAFGVCKKGHGSEINNAEELKRKH
jgi:hypothetical protein